jgi:hypothetical protein
MFKKTKLNFQDSLYRKKSEKRLSKNWIRLKLFALETKWKKQQITACKTHCWFSVSCALFLLFSFCACGEISVAKSQRVLLANRYALCIKIALKKTMMKKYTIVFLFLFSVKMLFAQQLEKTQLYGNWKFIELQDNKGSKITELPIQGMGKDAPISGVEKINRPNILLKDNGEYEQKFTEKNIDFGFWDFNAQSNELSFELRISPDSPYLRYFKGIEKRKDGFYYQKPIKNKVLLFESNKMIITDDRLGYVRIYQKE